MKNLFQLIFKKRNSMKWKNLSSLNNKEEKEQEMEREKKKK